MFDQARTRVDQLMKLGHVVDKVEFILMGGTFMSLPTDYRDYFIRNLHDALSGKLGFRCLITASCGAVLITQAVAAAMQQVSFCDTHNPHTFLAACILSLHTFAH